MPHRLQRLHESMNARSDSRTKDELDTLQIVNAAMYLFLLQDEVLQGYPLFHLIERWSLIAIWASDKFAIAEFRRDFDITTYASSASNQ